MLPTVACRRLLSPNAPSVHHGQEKATPESGDFELSHWCERGDSNPHRPRSTRSNVMWLLVDGVESKCPMSVPWGLRTMSREGQISGFGSQPLAGPVFEKHVNPIVMQSYGGYDEYQLQKARR
jgi:hypothetical protein